MLYKVILHFKSKTSDDQALDIEADIFNSEIGSAFMAGLPYKISLTSWGDEVYGSLDLDLGMVAPVPKIQKGGLAYSQRGYYFCVFYGQQPAWPVEYIGQIKNQDWQQLRTVEWSLLEIDRKSDL